MSVDDGWKQEQNQGASEQEIRHFPGASGVVAKALVLFFLLLSAFLSFS